MAGMLPQIQCSLPDPKTVNPEPQSLNFGLRFSRTHVGSQVSLAKPDLQNFLCSAQWSFWHSVLQYYNSHPSVHALSLMASDTSLV
jgi:hypothetical protein